MAVLRCLIDTMIFDALVAEPELLALVARLTSARRLELLAAPATIEQILAPPDRARRRRLLSVRVLVVPPADDDPVGAQAQATLMAVRGVGHADAEIAAAALVQAVPLVTQDRSLRLAAAERLPGLVLWNWDAELRPRLVAQGQTEASPGRR